MQISDKELQVINQLEFDGHYELAEFLRSHLEGLKEELSVSENQYKVLAEEKAESDQLIDELQEQAEGLKEEVKELKDDATGFEFASSDYRLEIEQLKGEIERQNKLLELFDQRGKKIEEFLNDNEQLRGEVKRLTAENKLYHENLVAIHDEKAERYRTALERFADRNNWTVSTFKGQVIMEWNASIQGDPEMLARKALQGSE